MHKAEPLYKTHVIYFSHFDAYHRLYANRTTLQWHDNGRNGISNHQPHDCSLNCLFRYWSKITSKLRDAGLCAGNSPVTGDFPTQMAIPPENACIWWRHNSTPKTRSISYSDRHNVFPASHILAHNEMTRLVRRDILFRPQTELNMGDNWLTWKIY